jgi:hypothetical protein
VSKTLVIAEKPSVGRDLARVLPGPFEKKSPPGERQERSLEGPEHIISWAVGHLVQLAGPDEYDDKFKKWRMADLPIVPAKFKLVVRDERSQKQMTVVSKLMKSDEVDVIVQNVSLSELSKPPFKASVNFQKVLYTPGTRHERARETYIAQIDFVLREHVPNAFVRVNPLGLQVTYFRVDQAFEESRR